MFEAKFTVNGNEYITIVEWVGEKALGWDNNDGTSNLHHEITFYNSKKQEVKIDYWASRLDPNAKYLEGAISAIGCMITELNCIRNYPEVSEENFLKFAAEFDYDNDSRRAYKLFEDLVDEFKRFQNLFGEDFESVLNTDPDKVEEELHIEEA